MIENNIIVSSDVADDDDFFVIVQNGQVVKTLVSLHVNENNFKEFDYE